MRSGSVCERLHRAYISVRIDSVLICAQSGIVLWHKRLNRIKHAGTVSKVALTHKLSELRELRRPPGCASSERAAPENQAHLRAAPSAICHSPA
eukprot:6175820-Pleurochrysis_carterae.AAC.1